tara:strand:- start:23 stop:250 length:228 start_codon:yes stop_codon:yes gene_type:complete
MSKSNTNIKTIEIYKVGGKFVNSRYDIINHNETLISIIEFYFFPINIKMIGIDSRSEIIFKIFSAYFKVGFGVKV